jgi:murein DD-endopeptidase MepM/ murein hydrolase activator NlpD
MAENGLFSEPVDTVEEPTPESHLPGVWEYFSHAGMGDIALRLGTHALMLALILLVAWSLRKFYLFVEANQIAPQAALGANLPTPTPTSLPVGLPPIKSAAFFDDGIPRLAESHTTAPERPRAEVRVYTVQAGDTLFGIAEKFKLNPETILWANQAVLSDNPHNLRPGQELNILPVNGTYHRWSAGDGLNAVAKFFGVTPEDIINFPGNNLSLETIGDWANPNIEAGTWLIIPGGRREFVSWSAPVIPLDDPGVAQVLGPGACSSVAAGAVGLGAFIWPTNSHAVTGFTYSPEANHYGIDIDGNESDPVYAADSGVVVYAGWNNWGYGNMVVINHGNGWQTLYAHLSAFYVSCGQSLVQGSSLGAIGSTGNASGSHLHFEMMYNGTKVNPLDYLP